MMLQSVRENLKGTVAIFVLAIFIIPLILFGVEQLFVGSVGGTSVATVNGEDINRAEFQRELALEKQRLQQRFELEPNSPQLEDSALSGPVLQRMVQREALYQAALDGGMGASREELWKQIAGIDAFQVDGKFDYQVFKERISYMYTPATFLAASEKDFVLGHLNAGVSASGFVTEAELQLLAAITQQKRTFFTIEIPKQQAAEAKVSDVEVEAFYQTNSAQFTEPEKVTVNYVQVGLDQLAKKAEVSDADVQNIYEQEVAGFKADPKYTVAHILVEQQDKQETVISELSKKLADGEDFTALAKQYSDDLGSRESGGSLGVMIEEAYPAEFVSATKKLAVGEVSKPVTTDAGVHFIKLLEKTNVAPPTFEERKSAIANQLAREIAQEDYLKSIALLDEKTFGADSLTYAADALGVEVQTSEAFTRQGGSGVAADQQVVSAAFADDVLVDGQNSKVIELQDNSALVLRVKDHQPEQVKPLADVRSQIEQQLTNQKIAAELAMKAAEILAKINAGSGAAEVAKESGLEFKLHENASRTSFEINNAVLQKVFSMPRPTDTSPVLDQVQLPMGGVSVVGLTAVQSGSLADLEEAQKTGLRGQLGFQLSQAEMYSFENGVIEKAKIDMSK